VRARQFIRTQVSKRLEHNIASHWQGELPTASAYNDPPGPDVSPARINELRRPAKAPGHRP
jgi:hypothetical protein